MNKKSILEKTIIIQLENKRQFELMQQINDCYQEYQNSTARMERAIADIEKELLNISDEEESRIIRKSIDMGTFDIEKYL